MTIVDSSRTRSGATVSRKAEHIRINLEEDVSAKGVASGFDDYRFIPRALPEIDMEEVDLGLTLFSHRLGAPLFVSCMTGGVPEAEEINLTLAEVAQELGLAIGIGSARVLLEHPEVLSTFDIRRRAPTAFIMANIGAVQLNHGVGADQCRHLVDLLRADALVLHLNALQEALQPEGNTTFGGLLAHIEKLCSHLEIPVLAKEVGWGLSADMVRALLDAGIAAVDVAGAGGTSWSEVERHRMSDPVRRRVAAAFAGWGIPTADAVIEARQAAPEAAIFASGGIRDGMDVAKALALGADMAGMAGPFLRAAAQGPDDALDLAREVLDALRIAMFCLGVRTPAQLRGTSRIVGPRQPRAETRSHDLIYKTGGRGDFIDITPDVDDAVHRSGVMNGLATICSFHTTAAICVNENEPLLLTDFRRMLDRLVPLDVFDHDDLTRRPNVPPDEPRNGHSHCQHLLLSSSESLPIRDGRVLLGTWQRIFLIELDSARTRRVTVQVIAA